jgi:serine phosphatase RsbU (regulator of sigma subunit)
LLMHETILKLEHPDFYVTALVARWHATTATLRWVNCGHPPAYLVDTEGNLSELEGHPHPALGAAKAKPTFTADQRRLRPGERLILLTDGITERHMENGTRFGVDGLRSALENAANPTAACTAMAITKAVTDYWQEPLEDDATVVVMAIA